MHAVGGSICDDIGSARQGDLSVAQVSLMAWHGTCRSTVTGLRAGPAAVADVPQRMNSERMLADMANGNSAVRLTVQRFVQGRMLDDVLEEASGRLRAMSSNRFWLLRSSDSSDG